MKSDETESHAIRVELWLGLAFDNNNNLSINRDFNTEKSSEQPVLVLSSSLLSADISDCKLPTREKADTIIDCETAEKGKPKYQYTIV